MVSVNNYINIWYKYTKLLSILSTSTKFLSVKWKIASVLLSNNRVKSINIIRKITVVKQLSLKEQLQWNQNMLLKNKRGHRSIFLRSDISLNEGRFVTSLFSHAEENFPKNCKCVYNLLPFKTVIFALSLPIHFCGNFKIH